MDKYKSVSSDIVFVFITIDKNSDHYYHKIYKTCIYDDYNW